MKSVQVGRFPGRLDCYAVEEGTTVGEVLELAGLTVDSETEIKVDGEVASVNDKIDEYTDLIVLAKKLKAGL
jgi:hypothetical protein